jgi:hypothetical protein
MEDLVSDLHTGSNTLLSSFWEEEDSMRTFFFALSNDKNRFCSVLYQGKQLKTGVERSAGDH